MITLLAIFGDGYTNEVIKPFIDYLTSHNVNVMVVPLREENETCSYDELDADNYCDYIDSYVEKIPGFNMSNAEKFKSSKLVGYGISKGAHHIKVYATKRPNLFRKIVLVEDTMMNPKNMVKFEKDRGNDFVEEYDNQNREIEGLDATHKALNAIVNDDTPYIPKCPITLVWTSRNNENEEYDETVLRAKRDYTNYLRSHGAKITVKHINEQHCVDTIPKWFGYLLNLIK